MCFTVFCSARGNQECLPGKSWGSPRRTHDPRVAPETLPGARHSSSTRTSRHARTPRSLPRQAGKGAYGASVRTVSRGHHGGVSQPVEPRELRGWRAALPPVPQPHPVSTRRPLSHQESPRCVQGPVLEEPTQGVMPFTKISIKVVKK